MYRIQDGNSRGLSDVEAFVKLINSPPSHLRTALTSGPDIFIARAPGRLDVMGGIADYSGSSVLEMPIAEATIAGVQRSDDELISITSISHDDGPVLRFEHSITDLFAADRNELRERFRNDRASHWASYIVGVFRILRDEMGIEFPCGARILISSLVPIGKGVSSSAALEVATMQAVCAAFNIAIKPVKLALLCQQVENLIVGAPCGVMDQITSHCGIESSVTYLLCQPAEILAHIRVPQNAALWGIDSGVRHAVTGSDYSGVRVAAFMGYRIIADAAGIFAEHVRAGLVSLHDERWNGYLCNVTPADYEAEFAEHVPISMKGEDFLQRYGGTTDPVAAIDPARTYQIRASTERAIYENVRVSEFAELLTSRTMDLALLGELMYASHADYAECGLTEPGTERLVQLARENSSNGIYGARITGGGSGGTVAILTDPDAESIVRSVAEQYATETGRDARVFHGSSPGCAVFGPIRLTQVAQR